MKNVENKYSDNPLSGIIIKKRFGSWFAILTKKSWVRIGEGSGSLIAAKRFFFCSCKSDGATYDI